MLSNCICHWKFLSCVLSYYIILLEYILSAIQFCFNISMKKNNWYIVLLLCLAWYFLTCHQARLVPPFTRKFYFRLMVNVKVNYNDLTGKSLKGYSIANIKDISMLEFSECFLFVPPLCVVLFHS